ncbi:MAG TPA: hypothetical protein VLA96_11495 [Terriglobales bacterium]|nr:hypothetical protein [Terriglobales bacterium]
MTSRFIGFGVLLIAIGCQHLEESLNRGLEEEKSLTRNAMLAYRRDPKAFENRIFRDSLREWSRMDAVLSKAQAVRESGPWARTADQVPGVSAESAADDTGQPYCVVRAARTTYVFGIKDSRKNCRVGVLDGMEITGYSDSSCTAESLCYIEARGASPGEARLLVRD